jgi:hypothetical protein
MTLRKAYGRQLDHGDESLRRSELPSPSPAYPWRHAGGGKAEAADWAPMIAGACRKRSPAVPEFGDTLAYDEIIDPREWVQRAAGAKRTAPSRRVAPVGPLAQWHWP